MGMHKRRSHQTKDQPEIFYPGNPAFVNLYPAHVGLGCMSKTIIVTGASNGLGAAISRKLVSLGHTVIGVGRCEKRLAKLREGVQSDNFIPIVGDVRDGDTLERTLKQSFDGQVHGLILNAGATRPIGRIANTPIGDFEE